MNKEDILKYSEDELVNLMINDLMLASKVSVLRHKSKNKLLSTLCKNAHKKYKSITKKSNQQKARELYKSSEEKWNEKYPNSFRYRSPEQICNIIKNNSDSLILAWSYVSPCKANSRLSTDLIERTKQGLILYYKSLNITCYKLYKLLR